LVRYSSAPSESARSLETVHHRHIDVDQGEIEVVAGDSAQTVHSVLRLHQLGALEPLECEHEQLTHCRAVFDDENPMSVHASLPPAREALDDELLGQEVDEPLDGVELSLRLSVELRREDRPRRSTSRRGQPAE
jgi:hypothetical protein